MSQRGHVVKPVGARKTWAITYYEPDGHRRWEGKFKTRGAAQARLNAVLGEIDRGAYQRPSEMTFEQFAENWLAGRRQIRGSTESGYGSIVKRQLVPRLGSCLLGEMRFERVDAAVSGMVENELSPKTIRNAVTLLRTMLAGKKAASAIRRGLMIQDPTLGVELPQLDATEIVPPTPDQTRAIIGAAKAIGGVGYPLAYVGAFTGVRRNEALTLRFSDIDWFSNEVRARGAVSKERGNDGAHKWQWRIGKPKSFKSNRRISGTESVMRMLADLKVGKGDSDFLFPSASGGFIDPDMFDLEVWKPIAEAAKLPGTRFHDMRRFFVSFR